MHRGQRVVLVTATIVLTIGIAGVFHRQQAQIDSLSAQVSRLENASKPSERPTTLWPVTVDRPSGPSITYESPQALAYELIRHRDDSTALQNAIERDIHRNPALVYWLAETHAAIDLENDPLPYLAHEDLMRRQASSWDREPYMAFPYDVIYAGGQN